MNRTWAILHLTQHTLQLIFEEARKPNANNRQLQCIEKSEKIIGFRKQLLKSQGDADYKKTNPKHPAGEFTNLEVTFKASNTD